MRALLFAATLSLLAGCTSSDPAPAPSAPAPQPDPEPAPHPEPDLAPVAEVIPEVAPTLTGPLAFTATLSTVGITPARMDAVPKMAITWRNADPTATHSVVSDDGGFVGSGPIAPGGEFTVVFGYAGDFPYHCRYHPGMTGTVIVR